MEWTKAKVLRQIKALKGQVSNLTNRLGEVCSWEKGKEPCFSFEDTLKQRAEAIERLVALKTALAITNANDTLVCKGKRRSVQEIILLMAEIKSEINLYASFHLRNEEQQEYERIMGENGVETVVVKREFISALDEVEREQKLASLRAELETLNDLLEAHNHQTTILV